MLKVGTGFVREADEVKIAQHFSAVSKPRFRDESVKRTTEVKRSLGALPKVAGWRLGYAAQLEDRLINTVALARCLLRDTNTETV